MKGLNTLLVLFSFSTAAAAVEVPLRIGEDQVPLVTLTLNGKPADFMLDTGAAEALYLKPELRDRLPQLKYDKSAPRTIDLAGKVKYDRHFTLSDLDINGEKFTHVGGVDYQPWGLNISEAPKTAPGVEYSVIGLELFRQHAIEIDVRRGVMSIEPAKNQAEKENGDGWIDLPFKQTSEGLMVKMNRQGTVFNMGLDTGASWSFLKRTPKIRPADLQPCAAVSDTLPTMDCQVTMISLNIGQRHRVDLHAMILDHLPPQFEADGLLGMDFFAQFRVRIDLKNQQLQVKPYT